MFKLKTYWPSFLGLEFFLLGFIIWSFPFTYMKVARQV